MKKQIPTFTEFLGKMPQFDDIVALDRYLAEKEEEYCELYKPGIIDRIKIAVSYLRMEKLRKLDPASYESLDERQKASYDDALFTLNVLLSEGKLEMRNLHDRILDFGCGSGGSSILLGLQSNDVTAVEKDEAKIQKLKDSGLFPKEKAITCDGIRYMSDMSESSYDLITAFYFGEPDTPADFIKDFYSSSKRAIKAGGRIVMTSDFATIDKAREIFNAPRRKYNFEILSY
ncbi:MAG: class I SAM-dependent methyltransferase [Candidatus Aenigmarchaeota archaeon]|nr:class I SAM-dependent methyltransferase [Candidatus Aenigmarchaeota archaeon]